MPAFRRESFGIFTRKLGAARQNDEGSRMKIAVILNEASAGAKVAGRCAVKDPVRFRANQASRMPEGASCPHGILRLRDARHLRPPGITPPQNDSDFDAITLAKRFAIARRRSDAARR